MSMHVSLFSQLYTLVINILIILYFSLFALIHFVILYHHQKTDTISATIYSFLTLTFVLNLCGNYQ